MSGDTKTQRDLIQARDLVDSGLVQPEQVPAGVNVDEVDGPELAGNKSGKLFVRVSPGNSQIDQRVPGGSRKSKN